jgi:hypothetical protein
LGEKNSCGGFKIIETRIELKIPYSKLLRGLAIDLHHPDTNLESLAELPHLEFLHLEMDTKWSLWLSRSTSVNLLFLKTMLSLKYLSLKNIPLLEDNKPPVEILVGLKVFSYSITSEGNYSS